MSMKVGELAGHLRSYPPPLRVVVDGYEEDDDDLSLDRISLRRTSLATGTESWQGRHGDAGNGIGTDSDVAQTIEALVFRRASR